MTKAERRDPNKIYNIYSFDKLVKDFGGINWESIFKAFEIPTNDKIVVTEPAFFNFMSEYLQLAKTNSETMTELKNFIKYKLLKSVCTHVIF